MPDFQTPSDQFSLLRDAVRTLAYRAAIFARAKDQVVLDLGCGSGVLSIFAAQAGARHVYAVERGGAASLARLMFKANGVEDRVTLLREDSRKVQLPEPAGLLVHELFGADPLSEGLIATLDDARARLLAPSGRMLPYRLEVGCFGLESRRHIPAYEHKALQAAQLSAAYGVDFSPFEMAMATQRAAIPVSSGFADEHLERILTREARLFDFGLTSSLSAQAAAPREIELEASRDGRLGGVMLFFRAWLDDGLSISTSPYAPRTHWNSVIYEFTLNLPVKAGDRIPLRARVEAQGEEHRVAVELA